MVGTGTVARRADATAEKSAVEAIERDIELENIVGNLLIAQYQVDKLRGRLLERAWSSGSTTKGSAFIFKHNDKWMKLTIRADELPQSFAKTIEK